RLRRVPATLLSLSAASEKTLVQRVHTKTIGCLALILWLTAAGCSRGSTQDDVEDAARRNEAADDGAASSRAEETQDDEKPKSASNAEWRIDTLRTALLEGGWRLEDTAPPPPSVAIPEGASVEGVTAEREELRADIFVYRYPREGYARAHARAQDSLARTVVIQHARDLIAVVGRDKEHAQAV